MNQMLNIKQMLEELKLESFYEYIMGNSNNDNFDDVTALISEMCKNELDIRKKRSSEIRLKTANIPEIKTIDEYDFNWNPTISKREIINLVDLNFIHTGENVILVGTPGTGKTHIASALAVLSAKHKHSTYYIHSSNLVQNLRRALLENKLEERLKKYSGYKLLVIDELGYLPLGKEDGNLIFQLINMRYKKHSTIITSNVMLGQWDTIFDGRMIGAAILDRLVEKSHIISMNGRSYRSKKLYNKD